MGRKSALTSDAVATIRIGGSLAIPAVLRGLGADPAEVLADAGVDIHLFDDPDNLISYAGRSRLIRHCVAHTGCNHFGLLVGREGKLQNLGVVGYFVQNTDDVKSALRSLERFFHFHGQGATVTLAEDGAWATLSYDIYLPQCEATEQIYDGAVAMMYNVMRQICGHKWSPERVMFSHRKPDDDEPYRQIFRAPLIFDAERNALVFSSAFLSNRLPEADPELRRLLRKQIAALEAEFSEDFRSKVKRLLRSALLAGQGNAEQIANMLSIHNRTLSRQLRSEDTSFQELADECRYEIAQQLLRSSDMNIARIADVLDYADSSAFTRAFKRWSGTTPARWRVRQELAAG